jgi:hypothetical protein
MMDGIFPKRALTPRERDTRLPDEYRPKQLRADGTTDYGSEPVDLLDGVGIDLHKLEDEMNRNRLGEIAALVRALTYGEMMELAEAIWKARREGTIDQHSLPRMLHQWASPAADENAADGERVADKPSEP